MDWHYFGHAMWLADLGEVRVLFDPLLDGVHHGGVFEVEPRRVVNVEALRPDFIVVSHQHNDHFDIPSLARLARLDPDAVILTADELVTHAARALGFRTVATVETFSRVDLAGARLMSTPSYTGEVEWGLMVESPEGVVWNQIDSYHPEIHQVQETLRAASTVFERDVTRDMALALVRWQPVLETAAPTGDRVSFPFQEYADALGRIAAIEARAVVPSAAGVRQTAAYGWMNHYVYPVPLARVMRDLPARAPGLRVYPPTLGATLRVRGGEASFDPRGARAMVDVDEADLDPRTTAFRPVEIPPVRDPNPDGRAEGPMRAVAEAWLRGDLADALVRIHPRVGVGRALRYVVHVVFPATTDRYVLTVDAQGAVVARGDDDDYDALNVVAGSLLVDVIEGRRQWGDPLLGGMLRSSLRAYDLNPQGLAVADLSPTFLYYGLSYAESMRRATEWLLAQYAPAR